MIQFYTHNGLKKISLITEDKRSHKEYCLNSDNSDDIEICGEKL